MMLLVSVTNVQAIDKNTREYIGTFFTCIGVVSAPTIFIKYMNSASDGKWSFQDRKDAVLHSIVATVLPHLCFASFFGLDYLISGNTAKWNSSLISK